MTFSKTPNSPMRIAFEEWCTRTHPNMALVRSKLGYVRQDVRVAWRVWQYLHGFMAPYGYIDEMGEVVKFTYPGEYENRAEYIRLAGLEVLYTKVTE